MSSTLIADRGSMTTPEGKFESQPEKGETDAVNGRIRKSYNRPVLFE